jgi:RHS repeat-associated protein
MPGRSYSSSANRYRYTFNGKESDVETVGTGGGTQDYGFRIYNPALGKFLSVDPLTSKYPFYTPYQFAGNSPICSIDVDGLEGFVATGANGHGMVISVEQANEINKRVTVSAFKVGFSEELPKKFVEHYAYGNSTLVTLNETEMAGLNVTHVGLGSGKIGQQVNPQIEGILPGESRKISFTADDGVAGTSGTLGQFTIHGEGTFTSDESGGWSFTGKMIFMDVWDFNKETPEEEKSRVEQTGRARSDNGKRQTEFAADHLPGKPFGVLSKVVDIKQTSKDKSFDWFNGKKEGGEGNRDTKVNSKYNDETN